MENIRQYIGSGKPCVIYNAEKIILFIKNILDIFALFVLARKWIWLNKTNVKIHNFFFSSTSLLDLFFADNFLLGMEGLKLKNKYDFQESTMHIISSALKFVTRID